MPDNLLDTIRSNSTALTAQPAEEDQSQKIAQLLRARSGKSVGGPDIAASNLGEAQANVNSGLQLQGVQNNANAINAGQATQQAAQQQETQGQLAGIAQARRFDTVQTRLKTTALLNDLEQNRGKLDMARATASANQAAQNLRLQNQKYIDNLQQEAARARLDDANQFQLQLEKTILGDQEQILRTSLGNKSVLNANNRQFQQAMTNMSANDAYQMFRQESKADRERGIYTALGGVASAAVGGAGAYKSTSTAPEGSSQYDTAAGPGGGEASSSLALPSMGLPAAGPGG